MGAEGTRFLTMLNQQGYSSSSLKAIKGSDGKIYMVIRSTSDKDTQGYVKQMVEMNARIRRLYMSMNAEDSYRPFLVPFVESNVSHINMNPDATSNAAAWTDSTYWTWVFVTLPTYPDTPDTLMHFTLHELSHVISKNHNHNFPFFYTFKNMTSLAVTAKAFDPSKLNPAIFNDATVGACDTGNAIADAASWAVLMQKLDKLGERFGCPASY